MYLGQHDRKICTSRIISLLLKLDTHKAHQPKCSIPFSPFSSQTLIEEMLILLTFATGVMDTLRNLWMCHPCDPDGKLSESTLPEYCKGPPGAMLRLGLEPLPRWGFSCSRTKTSYEDAMTGMLYCMCNIMIYNNTYINTAKRCGEHYAASSCRGYTTEFWSQNLSNKMTIWYQCWQWYHGTR